MQAEVTCNWRTVELIPDIYIHKLKSSWYNDVTFLLFMFRCQVDVNSFILSLSRAFFCFIPSIFIVGGVGREIEFNCSFNSSTTLSSPCVVLGLRKSSENPVLILLTRVPSWTRSLCRSSNLTLLGCRVELDPAGGWDLTLPNSCCFN